MKVAVKNSKIEVDIRNFRPHDKGTLKGFFTLVEYCPDYPLGRSTAKCRLFTKGDQSWISFPAEKVEVAGTDTKYYPYVSFADKTFQNNLSSAAVEALTHEQSKSTTTASRNSVSDNASFDW